MGLTERIFAMKIHYPSPAELRKMDDLLLEIKLTTFNLRTCISDPLRLDAKRIQLQLIQEERTELLDKLKKLVKKWTYVPLCAGCYLPIIVITPHGDGPCELQKMDDIIAKIQYHCLYLQIYKRENKDDPKRKAEVADTAMTKDKLVEQLREHVKDWPYVPMCAENLLSTY